jgi:hypothetical protein
MTNITGRTLFLKSFKVRFLDTDCCAAELAGRKRPVSDSAKNGCRADTKGIRSLLWRVYHTFVTPFYQKIHKTKQSKLCIATNPKNNYKQQ